MKHGLLKPVLQMHSLYIIEYKDAEGRSSDVYEGIMPIFACRD
jgi:hypothetical protein